jgi:peptide/nickel transport system permease protein
MIPVLIGVSLLVFTIMYFTPGDPATIILGPNATSEQIAQTRHDFGLDKSFGERYINYVERAFLHFDLGKSYFSDRSVTGEVLVRLPYTLTLAGLSILFAVVVGVPLGAVAAINQNTWKDNAAMFGALFFLSMPAFWFALVLVMIFAINLRWLPVVGVADWTGYILPVIALGVHSAAGIARQTRSSMLEVIRQDYVTTARAKGQKEHAVVTGHILRNGLIPIVVVTGNQLGTAMGGALIAETIFSIPGLGTYMVHAISTRDYPVIQGGVLVIAVCFCLIMLLVDIVLAFVDPRIQAQFSVKKRKGSAAKWKTTA